VYATQKPSLEDAFEEAYLAHYGVKGMKWGQVKSKVHSYRNDPDSSGVSRREARSQIKTQNRNLSRNLQDFERASNRSDIIRTARRNRVDTQRKYEDFKSELKNQKSSGAIGRNKARVLLNQAKNERYANVYKSEQKTTGEKFIEALFAPRTA
jgi:hypothetical protein